MIVGALPSHRYYSLHRVSNILIVNNKYVKLCCNVYTVAGLYDIAEHDPPSLLHVYYYSF